MKVLLTTIAALSMLASSAFANQATIMDEQEEEGPYTTIASYDVDLTRGVNTFELTMEEAAEGGHISIWYNRSWRCNGFNIHGIEAKGVAEEAEFVKAELTNFEGVGHYEVLEPMTALMVNLHSSRLLGQQCTIHVRRANFRVPTMLEMLAKFESICEESEEGDICQHTLTRVDTEEREIIVLTEQDALNFGLESGNIYKIKGYFDIDEETETSSSNY